MMHGQKNIKNCTWVVTANQVAKSENRQHFEHCKGEQTRLDEEEASCWQIDSRSCQINYVTACPPSAEMQNLVLDDGDPSR